MKSQKKFEKFDRKLRLESLLKSTLTGIGMGATVAFVLAIVYWFMDVDGLYIILGAFAGVSVIGGLISYFTFLHPTALRNARRLDRYGLDERLITMIELANDDSFIAQKQREDALANLQKLDKKRVKLKIPAIILTLSLVFTALFAGMSTIEVLSEKEILPSGMDLIYKWFPADPPNQYDIVYLAGSGGQIIGNTEQTVSEGESTERVLAVADEGYMFYGWDDAGINTPSRVDEKINGHITVTALFVAVSDDGEGSDDEDAPDDIPKGDQGMPMGEDPNGEGGSRYIEVNQIIDGETYFRDAYEAYYNEMKTMVESSDLPPEIRSIIESYFGIIK